MSAAPIQRNPAAVHRMIAVFGNQTTAALALGVTQPTISEWASGKRAVPAAKCPNIERMTRALGSAVTCEEIRPDVAWAALRT